MGRDRGFKTIAIIALVFAVVGISVGFAAFSATLTISATDVNVSPENDFTDNINYQANSATLGASSVATTTSSSDYAATGSSYKALVDPGTVSGKTWSGITIEAKEAFTAVLTAVVENESSYTGYLKTITSTTGITCAAVGTGDSALSSAKLSTVCSGDTNGAVTVTVTGGSVTDTHKSGGSPFNATGSAAIAATSGTQTITVTINYNPTGLELDGDFKVTIPAISLGYSTAA